MMSTFLSKIGLPLQAAGDGTAAAAGGAAAAPASPEIQWVESLQDPALLDPGNFWMPVDAAVTADGVDWMFYGVLGLSIFCFVGITAAVIYFVIRYRDRPGHKPQPSPSHNDALEITWTVIPSIICVFLFLFGWRAYIDMATPPKHALEIQTTAQKWNWLFTHPNGVADDDLHVPVDRPVRLVMTATDVLHSFYVPAFRVKQDVVPNRYTYVWFKATKPGTYRLYCAEYCGTDHSLMKKMVVVHEPGGYERYLAAKEAEQQSMPPEQLGEKLYTERGCIACHSTDGTPRVGPTFKGSFGSEVALSDGSKVTVDENYIRESILEPQAKIHGGFPPSMPTFQGQLSDGEIEGLIAYIKSLK